ncbi:hypothetical protein V8G54_027754 [Vigna mungo]|uniref:AP2/ERF domain-containing protein n=1 Tax=Vigna mungo TaxID=3915 RepID=A0AAQ3MRC4_VIGMU
MLTLVGVTVLNAKLLVDSGKRLWGRFVAEIRDSLKKARVWLGTFDSAKEAAQAYDATTRTLRGPKAKTDFPISHPFCRSTMPLSMTIFAAPRYASKCAMMNVRGRNKIEEGKECCLAGVDFFYRQEAASGNNSAGGEKKEGFGKHLANILEKKEKKRGTHLAHR